jgi:hypothetical protein
MGHASRSARGQLETKNLSALRSEDRVPEREPDKPSFHIDIVEQSSSKVGDRLPSLTPTTIYSILYM